MTPGGTAARGLAPAALPDEIAPADAGATAAPFWQRLRSRPALLGAAALLVIAVAVAAILLTRGDGEEPEEATVGDEVTAALGESYEGALAADEIDRYFLSDLGVPIAVAEVVPGSDLDVVLTAYDEDGNELQRVDENGAGGPEWLVVKPDGGKFDVSAFGPGSYTLLISDALPPGAGARLTGNALGEGDSHNYPFDAPAGAQVAVVSEAQFDLALELWQGEEILVERDSGDGYEQIVFTVPADGSYAVTALQHSGSGDYRLLLLTHPDVLADVALGDTRIGAFAGDARYEYTLGVEPGTGVSINAAADNEADIVLEVKDGDGNLLASADDGDDGGSENLTFTVPGDGDGTVIIHLSELNGLNAGHFTLQIGEEPVDAVDVDTSRFVSELHGLRFEYPDSWSVAEGDFDPFVVALASDAALLEELLNDPDAAFQGVLAAFQTGAAADLGGESLETVLAEMPAFTDLASEGDVTQPPETTTVNEEDAATATVELDASDGTRYGARFVLIRAAGRFVLVLALAPLDQIDDYTPLLELVVQSLELHPPLEPIGKGDLAPGDSASEEVVEGAFHAWHLRGAGGQTVRIAVAPGDEFDVMVDVRDSQNRSVLDGGRVDAQGQGGEESADVTVPADETYLIYVVGYEGSFGPYTITVEPVEDSSSMASFEPGVLENPAGCEGSSNVERIEAVERFKVQFHFCRPEPAFLAKLALPAFGIASDEYLQATGGTGDLLTAPVGTGPYRLESWDQGSELLLARYDNYWDEPAATQHLIFRWTEAAGRLEALQNGEADGIDRPDNVDAVIHDEGLQLAPRTGLNTLYLGFNNTVAPFGDERVRRALAVGINRQLLVENYFGPAAEVATHFAPCAAAFGCEGEPWYAFDPDLGRQLLAEAGFPDGFATTIFLRDVVRPYLPLPVALAEQLKAQLAENLGIAASVEVLPTAQFVELIFEGTPNGVYLLGWEPEFPHASSALIWFLEWNSGQFGQPYPEIHEPLAAAAAGGDEATLYAEANGMIRERVPAVPLAHVGSTAAFRADVGGAYASALGAEQFARMVPRGRDTFVWVQDVEPSSLYCADAPGADSWRACAQIMETLVGFEGTELLPQPRLAHSWDVSSDGLTWTLYLRDDVTFHDGSPFDANDVVMTFAAGLDTEHPLHTGHSGEFIYYDVIWGLFAGD